MNTDIFLLINGWAGKNNLLDNAMIFSAHYLIYAIFMVAALCVGYLFLKKQWRECTYFSVSLLVTFIILLILSQVYISDRPFVDQNVTQLIAHAANQSFPSDHATSAMSVALSLLVFTRFKRTAGILVIAAAIVGFSRIFVGVHYPLDVLGGILTAATGATIIYLASRYRHAERSTQTQPED